MEQLVKKCTLCGEVKPIDHFYKRAMMKDGHRSECKVCNDGKRAERRSKAQQVKVEEELSPLKKVFLYLSLMYVFVFCVIAIKRSLS